MALISLTSSSARLSGSVQESVRGRDFTPSLWECGNPRLNGVSKRRGRSCLGLYTVDAARHFHSELTDSAHFGEKRPLGTPQEHKRHFPKSRVDWAFSQIVVQSRLSKPILVLRLYVDADWGAINSCRPSLGATAKRLIET